MGSGGVTAYHRIDQSICLPAATVSVVDKIAAAKNVWRQQNDISRSAQVTVNISND